jgi:hypothetical protein
VEAKKDLVGSLKIHNFHIWNQYSLRGQFSTQVSFTACFGSLLKPQLTKPLWIMHKTILTSKNWGKECLTHFQFLMSMCKALIENYTNKKLCVYLLKKDVPKIHCLIKSHYGPTGVLPLNRLFIHVDPKTNVFLLLQESFPSLFFILQKNLSYTLYA